MGWCDGDERRYWNDPEYLATGFYPTANFKTRNPCSVCGDKPWMCPTCMARYRSDRGENLSVREQELLGLQPEGGIVTMSNQLQPGMTPDVEQITEIAQRIVTAKISLWDAERELERAFGKELDTFNLIEHFCIGVDDAACCSVAPLVEEFYKLAAESPEL
jgi:hypothetical protein